MDIMLDNNVKIISKSSCVRNEFKNSFLFYNGLAASHSVRLLLKQVVVLCLSPLASG